MKKIIISALAIVAMASCQKGGNEGGGNENEGGSSNDHVVVNFSSSQLPARLSDNGSEWSEGDQVGVFMATKGDADSSDRANVVYCAQSSGGATSFVVAANEDEIEYTNSGDVDFYAYYPYLNDIADSYKVDVTEPKSTPDLLLASYKGADKKVKNVEFDFEHKLTKIQIVVTARDNIADIDGVKVSISGVSREVSFNIFSGEQVDGSLVGDNGTPIELEITNRVTEDGKLKGVVAEAILIPETIAAGKVTVEFGDQIFELDLEADTSLSDGKLHIYPISMGQDNAEFDGDSKIVDWNEGTDGKDVLFPGGFVG